MKKENMLISVIDRHTRIHDDALLLNPMKHQTKFENKEVNLLLDYAIIKALSQGRQGTDITHFKLTISGIINRINMCRSMGSNEYVWNPPFFYDKFDGLRNQNLENLEKYFAVANFHEYTLHLAEVNNREVDLINLLTLDVEEEDLLSRYATRKIALKA